MKKVYCLYRVSTKGQVDGDDIPMQRIACHEFVSQQGWEIVKEFSEKGISGFKVSSEKRDAIQAIKADASKNLFDILLVFMFDRLGRREDETPFVVQWFVTQGIEVWSVKEGQQRFDNHVDKLLNYIRFWQASGESEKTSMRIKTRHAQMVQEGLYRGGIPPFGYRLEPNGKCNKKGYPLHNMAVDPFQSQIVREIFTKTCHEGYGTHRLANYLNETYPDLLRKWQANIVNRIICNPIYTGRLRYHNEVLAPVETFRIIDDSLFERANYILHQRSTVNSANRTIPQHTNGARLLTGLLYCGHCGERMVGTLVRDKRKLKTTGEVKTRERAIYRCYGKDYHKRGCGGQSLYSAAKIEEAVLKTVHHVFQKIHDKPLMELAAKQREQKTQAAQARLDSLRGEKAKLERQKDNLRSELLKSINGEKSADKELLSSFILETQQALQSVSLQIDEAELARKEVVGKNDTLQQTYARFLGWEAEFSNASMPVRKMILANIIERITVDRYYNISIKLRLTAQQFYEEF
jgi:DNA invertase Pin-like site-specific DNA recombinase